MGEMEKVEIIEKYRDGKLYERFINGIPYPISPEESQRVAWTSWKTLPVAIEDHKIMTYEQFENTYGKLLKK